MRVLLATQKKFGSEAVKKIESLCEEAKIELTRFEEYEKKEDLINFLRGNSCEGVIVRSDIVDAEVAEVMKGKTKILCINYEN